MIKAVLFDMGGVYLNDVHPLVMDIISQHFSTNPIHLQASLGDSFDQLQRGEITSATCFAKAQATFGTGYTDEELGVMLGDAYEEVFAVNKDVEILIKALTVPVGLLSNTEKDIVAINRKYDLFSLFNPVILSCTIGMRKPEPGIYKYALEQLRLPAADCLFIDDRLENIAGAEKVGLQIHYFRGATKLRDCLQAYAVIP